MKNRLLYSVAVILASLFLSGCGNSIYEGHENGYTEITSVEGVKFDIPTALTSNSSLVSTLNSVVDKNTSYLYRTDTEWSFYNMNELVITVQKGTKFNVADEDSFFDSLSNSPINATWLDKDSKKDKAESKSENGVTKYYSTAKGAVAVTNELYGDYAGKLAIISAGGEEYSIFAGIKGNKYNDVVDDSYKEYIEHIVKTFSVNGGNAEDIMDADKEKQSEGEEIKQTEEPAVAETLTPTPTPTPVPTMEPTPTPIITPEAQPTDEVEVIEEEEDEKEKLEVISEEDEEAVEVIQEDEENELDSSVPLPTPIVPDSFPEYTDGQAVETGLYFSTGEWAEITALGAKGKKYVGNVNVTNILTGEDALSLMREALGKVPEVEAGCSWNVVEYATTINMDEAYIDVSLQGDDRKNLKFRGITYSQRGYDIYNLAETKGNVMGKLYCYYAVPNGCYQYSLGFGMDAKNKKYVNIYLQ